VKELNEIKEIGFKLNQMTHGKAQLAQKHLQTSN
jgi:hypothetical protein